MKVRKTKQQRWSSGTSTPIAVLMAAVAGFTLGAGSAEAAPTKRFGVDQRGDFVLFGNTQGWECGSAPTDPIPVPAPLVGTVGACGANTGDTSPDVFWRSLDENNPAGAQADQTITNAMARSTAVLALPAGAVVTYARLYWAAARPTASGSNDTTVTIERPGTSLSQPINADSSTSTTTQSSVVETFYQSSADVTDLIRTNGPGAYRVSGIETQELAGLNRSRFFVGWSVVVVYRLDSDVPRNLTIFDGLDRVEPGQSVDITLTGFLVPAAGFDAKLGVVAYEGDATLVGDALAFNGTALGGNATSTNPTNNFFNSSRSFLGNPVSNLGDLPRLTGGPRSLAGVDMDVVGVTGLLNQGDTMATIRASSTGDFYMTGVFVTSISTFKPDFTSTNKSYTNLSNRPGAAIRPGDILEYTISTTNTGNDTGTNVVLTDAIPTGLTYVPGSTFITAGANASGVPKSDVVDSDPVDFNVGARTLSVRLGAGANGTMGGTMAVNESATLKFRVTVDANAMGTIANQALVNASGMAGAPATQFRSDGDPALPGPQGTNTPVDRCLTDPDCTAATPVCRNGGAPHPWICVECTNSAQCTVSGRPFCDTATNTCRGCATNADCASTPATPVCHPSGRCTQCSLTNTLLCTGNTPRCNASVGTCAGCVTDADCSGATPICDATNKTCRACATDADCSATPTTPACQTTGALTGRCGECSMTNRARCLGATPACDITAVRCVECNVAADCPATKPACNVATHTCRPCQSDAECGGATPYCTGGLCAGCRTNADCAGLRPICSTASRTCVPCASDAECLERDAKTPACNGSGPLAGACTECSASNKKLCLAPSKPECLTTLGLCGCDALDGDSECGDSMSGLVCNAGVGICIPGCSTAPLRNGCPTGQTCSRMDGTIGICAVPMCSGDGDCANPTPRCDMSNPRACVQCLGDGDCKVPAPVCNLTNKTCVECTSSNSAACSAAVSGSRCLSNNTCGCQADGECGGLTSGRICDSGIEKCSPGCRGTGGNGCPPGFQCTSTTNAIGRCLPFGAPLDGGPPVATPDAPVAQDRPADLASDRTTDRSIEAAEAGVDAVAADRTAEAGQDVAADTAPRTPDAAVDRVPTDTAVDAESVAAADASVQGIDGYLAGGGCSCRVGTAGASGSTPAGSRSLAALVLVGLGLAAAGLRRRRRG